MADASYPRVPIKDIKVYLSSLEDGVNVTAELTEEITKKLQQNPDDQFLRVSGLILTNQLLLMAGMSSLLQNMLNVKEDLGET